MDLPFQASAVDRELVMQPASCKFTASARNAVLPGGPLAFKSHPATATATAIGVGGWLPARHARPIESTGLRTAPPPTFRTCV
jgi:hypothetical protein